MIDSLKNFKCGGLNFAYDLCIRKITPEERTTLDLSSWQVAFNESEPVRADTIERFAQTFADSGFRRQVFYPCYGMAETTLIVSGGCKAAPPILQAVTENHELQVYGVLLLKPGNISKTSIRSKLYETI